MATLEYLQGYAAVPMFEFESAGRRGAVRGGVTQASAEWRHLLGQMSESRLGAVHSTLKFVHFAAAASAQVHVAAASLFSLLS